MPNPYFRFKQFTVFQDRCAMKVTTDGCLFGGWCAAEISGSAATNALDIGAGSGLLSLMVAQKNKIEIDAVEVDASAAGQAAENIAASPWRQNIHLHHCDILNFAPTHRYDVIFSNPPFYERELASGNELRRLAHHGSGLRLEQLIAKAYDLLAEDGALFLLLPFKRQDEAEAILNDAGFYILKKLTVHPSASHPPFRLLLHVSKRKAPAVLSQTIYIKDEAANYTEAFTALLKDYYLYL